MFAKLNDMMSSVEKLLDRILFTDIAYTSTYIETVRQLKTLQAVEQSDVERFMKVLPMMYKLVSDIEKVSTPISKYEEFKQCKSFLDDEVGI